MRLADVTTGIYRVVLPLHIVDPWGHEISLSEGQLAVGVVDRGRVRVAHQEIPFAMLSLHHALPPFKSARIELTNTVMAEVALSALELVAADTSAPLTDGIPEHVRQRIVYALNNVAMAIDDMREYYRIDRDAVADEVHRSNMTKEPALVAGGRPRKGDAFRPPDISSILKRGSGDYE